MHPLVPYLLGEKHPAGTRLANSQKCVRTGDIDEVGDNRHLTFFEMLGNWSLGDYFKKESIPWSFEFLTASEWLNIDPSRIYVTVFEGDADAPHDEESTRLWEEVFKTRGIDAKPNERIFAYPKSKNWWGPPAPPDHAVPTPRSSTIRDWLTTRHLAPRAIRIAIAAVLSKSGTTCSWNSTRRWMAGLSR
jgi:alanyl-tRNA synthetase